MVHLNPPLHCGTARCEVGVHMDHAWESILSNCRAGSIRISLWWLHQNSKFDEIQIRQFPAKRIAMSHNLENLFASNSIVMITTQFWNHLQCWEWTPLGWMGQSQTSRLLYYPLAPWILHVAWQICTHFDWMNCLCSWLEHGTWSAKQESPTLPSLSLEVTLKKCFIWSSIFTWHDEMSSKAILVNYCTIAWYSKISRCSKTESSLTPLSSGFQIILSM